MDEPAEIVEARALVRTRTVVATGVGLVACALGLALLTLEVPDYALGFLVAAFFTSSLGVAFHRPWRDAERRLEAWTARREAPPTAEPSPATPDDPRVAAARALIARIDALGADDGVDRVTAQAVDQLRALVADLALLEASVAAESDPHRRATLEAAAARSGDQLDGLLGSLRTLHAELAVRAADGGVAADVGDLVQRVAATSEVDAAARRVREAAHRASGRTAQ